MSDHARIIDACFAASSNVRYVAAYLDETRPVGWSNTLFPNVSMPNPLWEMQGLQHAVLSKPDAAGEKHVERLEMRSPGTQSAEQYDQSSRTTSDPAAP